MTVSISFRDRGMRQRDGSNATRSGYIIIGTIVLKGKVFITLKGSQSLRDPAAGELDGSNGAAFRVMVSLMTVEALSLAIAVEEEDDDDDDEGALLCRLIETRIECQSHFMSNSDL